MVNRNYTGKSGQLAVMAEFLIRGYNVAMPEVDEGDDVFVVHHDGDQRGSQSAPSWSVRRVMSLPARVMR